MKQSERKKSYGLLIFSIILLIGSIAWTIYYRDYLSVSKQLSNVKAQKGVLENVIETIASVQEGQTTVEEGVTKVEKSAENDKLSEELQAMILSVKEEVFTDESEALAKKEELSEQLKAVEASTAELSEEKLRLERPYSYGLTGVFMAILFLLRGLYNALKGSPVSSKKNTAIMVQAGFLAALCYIGFAFCKIDIPVGTEKTAFHLGNTFCALAALLLGGYWGGLAGAVGMTIGDLTTAYVTSAPKTFLLKLCIGLIVGFVAHKLFKLSRSHDAKYVTGVTILSCICGLGFNVIADPLVGYFYKTYLLGVPQDASKLLAKISAMTTFVNAVIAVIAASIIYLALRPALKKSGLFVQVTPEALEEKKDENDQSK